MRPVTPAPAAARLAPGARVRLTGAFLRSTGQYAGGEGHSRWTVIACGCPCCASGLIVRVDQEREDLSYWTAEEIAADPTLRYRHILAKNLEAVRGAL